MLFRSSPQTPYIFDDRVDDNKVASAILKMYELGKEERKRKGSLGREFMIQNLSSTIMCNKMTEGIEMALSNWKPRKKFELFKIS